MNVAHAPGRRARRNPGDTSSKPELRARGISVQFAGVRALNDVDLTLAAGHILGLIGPNGAGKTTLVNVLTGFQQSLAGAVTLGAVDVTRATPRTRSRAGIVRTFQGARLFTRLTVFENVEAAAVQTTRSRRVARQRAATALERVGLHGRATMRAGDIPQGEQRLLGIARALCLDPMFMLLDEPAAGLDDRESSDLVDLLASIVTELEIGMLIIEHDMSVIMRLCHTVQVLDYGITLALDTPEAVRVDPTVLDAYLGSTHA